MDVAYHGRAVCLDDTLVFADLHLGREAASNVQLPMTGDDVRERVGALLERFDPETVVIAGDLLHSFETVPPAAVDILETVHDAIRDAGARAVATEGNHDVHLDTHWPGPTVDEFELGDTVVCHGHERPSADADRYVVGHDHPALVVEGRKRPCCLRGPAAGGGHLLMVPAFDRLAGGMAVNDATAADFQSPLVENAGALSPVVWDEDAGQVYEFPSLERFRHRL